MFVSRLLGSQCLYRLRTSTSFFCVKKFVKSPTYTCRHKNSCHHLLRLPGTGSKEMRNSQNLMQQFTCGETDKITLRASNLHTSTHLNQFEDTETKSLTVWTDLKQIRTSPLPALTLGLSGLIPFVSAPAILITSQLYMPDLAFAQVAYGAAILSFLGGVRWGFAVADKEVVRPNWFNLGYSVTPSLVAWIGLMLPQPAAQVTLMGALAATAYFDMAMYGYPAWFKGLRFLLSFVAILSLWTTFMCKFMLPEAKFEDLGNKQGIS